MRILTIACAVAVLCGCANEPKAPPVTGAYAGLPLAVFTHGKPDFAAITWSRVMMNGGVAAGLESVAEGNDIVKEFEVDDPALAIAASLETSLSASLRVIAGAPVRTDLFQVQPGAKGLVLDVLSENWAFSYLPADPAQYQVKYMGRARLVDAATGAELVSAPCRWASEDNKNAPGYDELLAGRAALLKDMLAAAARDCAVAYRKQFLAAPALQQTAPAVR